MNKVKNLFSTPKKAILSSSIIIAIIAIIGILTSYTVRAVAQNNSVSADEAKAAAIKDAGLDENDVTFSKADFDKEYGEYVYEVEVYADGKEYDYIIRASDGTVITKDVDVDDDSVANTTKKTTAKATEAATTASSGSSITLAQAKNVALNDAGVKAANATFTKAKTSTDDGVTEYEIEFIAGNYEYEYEINAKTGAITDKDRDRVSSAKATNATTKATTYDDDDDDDDTTRATTKANTTKAASSNYIGVSKAKSIALNKAGVSSSNARFTTAKLDNDDGVAVYEIEFTSGNYEYDFEINAKTGAIIEWDRDYDDD